MINIKKHPKRSRNPLVMCDMCDKNYFSDTMFDVIADKKVAHYFIVCKGCAKRLNEIGDSK